MHTDRLEAYPTPDLEFRSLGLASKAFDVGHALLQHRCEFLHREALACEMAHEQHRDALGLRLERLMVRRLPCDERFASVLERKRQQTGTRTTDNAHANNMGILRIGAPWSYPRNGSFESDPQIGEFRRRGEISDDARSKFGLSELWFRRDLQWTQVSQLKDLCQLAIDPLGSIIPSRMGRVDRYPMADGIPEDFSSRRLRGDSIDGFEWNRMMDNDQLYAAPDRFFENRARQTQASHQGPDSDLWIACQESDVVPAFSQLQRGNFMQVRENLSDRWIAI